MGHSRAYESTHPYRRQTVREVDPCLNRDLHYSRRSQPPAPPFKTEPCITGSGFADPKTRCRWHPRIFTAIGFYESKSKEEVEKHMASKSAFTKFVALTRSRGWAAFCLALWLLGLGLSASAREATFVEFDVPGSACEARFPFCTTPVAINPAGAVTGYYADSNAALHGFLRAPDGTFTTFDPPGSLSTAPVGINPAGAITGYYCDAVTCHGFLRTPDGTLTPFDPPGSVLTQSFSGGINPAGAITGTWYDAVNFLAHGFLRAPDGAFTVFDAPGAVNGTTPTAINPAGAITGVYYDANFVSHGFLRALNGAISTFDPPGSAFTGVNAIDPAGTVAGFYYDASAHPHGFLRARDGTLTTFDVPGAVGTAATSISPSGAITGLYSEARGSHGFLRARDGTFITFDPPGSDEPYSFTIANGIDPAGVIAGWYIDPSFLGHGFLRIP